MLKLAYDERHRLHSDPLGTHPEGVWRVEKSLEELRNSPAWSYIELVKAVEPDYNAVLLVHDRVYVEWLISECAKGFHYIDPDTYVTQHTCDVAASFATTARVAALDTIRSRDPWFIMARPGGHHAGRRGPAMGAPTLGFCIFDYAAIAAKTLVDLGYRVMILDFDAHHGNGTQEIFWCESNVLHIDIHQRYIYPGTGWLSDVGGPGAEGSKINIPLYPGSNDNHYSWILENVVERARELYKPDVVVVFAGFDAHKDDRLTNLQVSELTYALYGSYLRRLLSEGKVVGLVSILGGGYGQGMIKSFRAFIEGLVGVIEEPVITPKSPGKDIEEGLELVFKMLKELVLHRIRKDT